jgi:hypothetical protein
MNIQKLVDEANNIMKKQVGPYIDDRIAEVKPWTEAKIREIIKEMIKEDCLK